MADHAAAAAKVADAVCGDPSLRQAGAAGDDEAAAAAGVGVGAEERCRAMMEVVKKDAVGGKWRVSKLVVEHNHEVEVAPCGEGEVAAAVPVMGMEFDSVHAAKGFYYGYGERVGFKARTGSNRRSVGNGVMIMQRFLCSRGNYANRRYKANGLGELKEEEVQEGAAGKRKRGANNKSRNRNLVKNHSEVIEVESSAEKGVGAAVPNNGQEARRMRGSKRGRTKMGVIEKDGKSVVELEAEKEDEVVAQNGDDNGDDVEEQKGEGEEEMEEEVQVEVKEKRGRGRPRKADKEGNALQARVLRELGLRASQYTNEERKKIVSKYLSKRQSRPVSARPAKIASRQALAERRKRGDGGRFLASEGLTPLQQPLERRSKRLEKQNLKKEDKGESLPDPEEAEVPLRVDPPTISNDIPNHLRTPTSQFLAPSHIMQAPYVAQQFGLSSLQGFPGISPFGQEPAPAPLQQPHLQQPPFHSGPQIPQAPPDIQSLQFLSSNPQLGHQATDQSQYTIPVWDFL
uniref:Uncharacterized protein n=1 Tax=Oryza punctata TaxID=4537 RepID=A0A0E0KJN7_ORYPU